MDPGFSRLVEVPESASAAVRMRTWHILDNGPVLEESAIEPAGTILCVHGNPTWSYLWRRLVREATDQARRGGTPWRVIAVDQLEMGYSERTGTSRSLERRVRDLGDLSDTLTLSGPVGTFGHDWGGVVSLGWAVDHPELLASVLLLNTAVHQPEGDPIPAPLRLALAGPILTASTVTTPAFLETTLALAHPKLADDVRAAYRAPYRTRARRGGIGGFVADIPVDSSHESWNELNRISDGVAALRVPALFQWGPRDPIFGDRYLDDLVDRMPQADVQRYESAGHLVAEDVDYAGTALEWLDESHAVDATNEPTSAAGTHEDGPRLWGKLDALRDSADPALIEMAPRRGAKPRTVSWSLLSRRVDALAIGLARRGVVAGDRVSLLIPPGADLTAVLYACLRIGAVVVVADAGLGLRGLTRAVRGTWPDVVIGQPAGLAVARALGWPGLKISTRRLAWAEQRALGVSVSLPEIVGAASGGSLPDPPARDDVAAILFTSGSTGPAKGVVYTHRQLSAVCAALAGGYGIDEGTGLVAGFAPFALLGPAIGARSVTPDMDVTSPRTLTARAVGEAAAAAAATVVFLSPAALAHVVATADGLTPAGRHALAAVTLFLSAGAPVSESLLADASILMPKASAHTPYGMTEGLLLTDASLTEIRESQPDDAGGVCVGLPNASTTVRISALDLSGAATGALSDEPGLTGEIVVSAPHVKDHYHRLWVTDRDARRNSDRHTSWHRTGDVGHFDGQGRLWIEGRLPHVIVTADGVITPVGLEQRIERVHAVSRAAVVGVGPSGTAQVVAVVELPTSRKVSLASRELAEAVRAAAGRPLAAVLTTPRLPTDIRHNSKIDRTALSRWATEILAGGKMRRP